MLLKELSLERARQINKDLYAISEDAGIYGYFTVLTQDLAQCIHETMMSNPDNTKCDENTIAEIMTDFERASETLSEYMKSAILRNE